MLNLSPCVLQLDAIGRVWSENGVFYDHLPMFGYKNFVHIPKDERSKLDVMT